MAIQKSPPLQSRGNGSRVSRPACCLTPSTPHTHRAQSAHNNPRTMTHQEVFGEAGPLPVVQYAPTPEPLTPAEAENMAHMGALGTSMLVWCAAIAVIVIGYFALRGPGVVA